MCEQKVNIEFVLEVEKHEVLYNYKLAGYSRKDVVEKAWQEVAAKVNMTAAECKEKWRNLRTVFTRKMKPPSSGSGANKNTYYLAEAMQFCLPFIKVLTPPSSGNLPIVPQDEMTDEISDNIERCDESASSDIMQSSESSEAAPTQLTSNSSVPTKKTIQFRQSTAVLAHPSTQASFPRPKQSRNNKSTADADLSVAEYFRAKTAKLDAAVNKADTSSDITKKEALKMFLLSLLPELGELSDVKIKIFKRRVLSLIDEISTPLHPRCSSFITTLSPKSDYSQTSGISVNSGTYALSESIQDEASPSPSSPVQANQFFLEITPDWDPDDYDAE